jgi:hypothetical protein
MDMSKRSVAAAPAEQNFIKAYFELKRLREDIAYIERSSKRPARPLSAAGREARKSDDGVPGMLRP